jgi:hypothetical protein
MTDLVSINIAAWLACAAFLTGLVNGALKLTDRIKGIPPNAELGGEVKSLTQRIVELERIAIEGVERRRKIYEQIEKNREATEHRFQTIEQRLTDLPDRIIATLRNTGALK